MAELIVVEKRYPGERLDIREFVRPYTPMVQELVARLGPRPPIDYWRWVIENIRYPWGRDDVMDIHQEGRYLRQDGSGFLIEQATNEFWEYPSEVLRDRTADCEGSAALLVSCLRHFFPPDQVFCTVGYWNGIGHVWATMIGPNGPEVMDTTLSRLPERLPVLEGGPYQPILRFNDELAFWVETRPIPDRTTEPKFVG